MNSILCLSFQVVDINNWLGVVLVVAGTVGPDVFPVIVGQFMEEFPMLLVYMAAAVVGVCVALFALAYFVAQWKE